MTNNKHTNNNNILNLKKVLTDNTHLPIKMNKNNDENILKT